MRNFMFLAILLSFHFNALAQTTWYVPDDFTTIQGAISDATVLNGDTVIVRPGTYVENIDFLGKAIALISEQGPSYTTIDGGSPSDPNHGSVAAFMNGEGSDSVLEGFELTKGTGTRNFYGHNCGGGIHCSSASPTISNNTITDNSAVHGGGIYCMSASYPTISNNDIRDNTAGGGGGIYCGENSSPTLSHNKITENSAFAGGGINCYLDSSPAITYNTLFGNSAHTGGGILCEEHSSPNIKDNGIQGNTADWMGGGICCIGDSSPTIMNNKIAGNTAVADDGGGICCEDYASPTISNNTITGNSAGIGGGGISNYWNCHPTITNNTIVENSAVEGGGLYCLESYLNIHNTILWNNAAPTGPEIWIGQVASASTVTIRYSDLMGGQSSVHVGGPGCSLNWGPSMIDTAPLFIDSPNGDYHIQYSSPCRDAGDNSGITTIHDFEGDPRVAYGTVDMGADEFYPHLYLTGETTPGALVHAKCTGLPGTLANGIIIGVDIFDPPLPCDYGLWYMKNPLQIITGLGTFPAEGVIVLPGTISATPPAPYTIYLQAAIDSWLSNLCTVKVQ